MVYSTEASKWRAYQFSDPFAAGSFVVCNKINTQFCRPDCDAHPVTELRAEIKFVDQASDALKLGYSACESCNPLAVPPVNVNLLLKTVKAINASIGFVQPLLDDDEDKVQESIKENIIGQGQDQRRMSLPSNAYTKSSKSAGYSVSKNDSEHYRLIDLACRHLALAAAISIFLEPASPNSPNSAGSSPKEESAHKKKNSKKRRGGVLGFKELATKSKLSAWHFHRVFKSIIGLTPKTYGDMCWEYLREERESMSPLRESVVSAGSEADAGLDSLAKSMHSPSASIAGQKRAAEEDVPGPDVKREHTTLFEDFQFGKDNDDKEFALGSRATSEPNLANIYDQAGPRTLFQHVPSFAATQDQMLNVPSHTSPEMSHQNSSPEFSTDLGQAHYPVAPMAAPMTLATHDFQLPSYGFDDDFSPVNISPASMTNETTPSDIEQLGLGFEDPMSMFFTPSADMGPLNPLVAPEAHEMPVFDDKKSFELAADPMMGGMNDMLVASSY